MCVYLLSTHRTMTCILHLTIYITSDDPRNKETFKMKIAAGSARKQATTLPRSSDFCIFTCAMT